MAVPVLSLSVMVAALVGFVSDYGAFVGHRDFAASLAVMESDRLLADCLDGDGAGCNRAAWPGSGSPAVCYRADLDAVRVTVEMAWTPIVMKGWRSVSAFRITLVGAHVANADSLFGALAPCP